MHYTEYTDKIKSTLIDIWLYTAQNIYTSVLISEIYGNTYLSFVDFNLMIAEDLTADMQKVIYDKLIQNNSFLHFCSKRDLYAKDTAKTISKCCVDCMQKLDAAQKIDITVKERNQLCFF